MLSSVSCFFFRGEEDILTYLSLFPPPPIFLPVLFSPSCRRTAFLFFEHTIKVGAGRKTAFGGNDVVAEVGVFQNHLLGCFKPHFGKPNAESGVEREGEIPRQFSYPRLLEKLSTRGRE